MSSWSLFGRKKKVNAESWNARTMFGPNMNFVATEAYKRLRTNIMFSFSDEGKGHVIGITSSVQAEGKSSTACNTAYVLSESGSRVLLMEGDLRKPTLGVKLSVPRGLGLTNLLVTRGDYREVIQHSALAPDLDILVSGDVPPNPSELLASARMEKLIEQLRLDYDYIVIDLPPVTAVSDTLAVSKLLDGVIMVVRAGVSDQQMLEEALRQMEMVNVRVLGFVYRDTDDVAKSGHSYKKKYYRLNSEYENK